jgi:serine/threonine-protein kinase RsbW
MSKYELSLRSERKNITQVEPFIRAIPECSSLEETTFFNMLIAVTEAVNNAIIHGNKCDPDKTASLSIMTSDSEILFTIQDEGHGFDPSSVADPRDPENLLREGGRGVFLIHSLVDAVHYQQLPIGMQVSILVKRR